ncbi:hypothetical protein FIBSPDRAFT_1036915 [Athelia psychrophila]|uniref:Swiss Army Knife RNA repair protein HAD domain-containing protein n=1 Tax=Athelia psychrophila TaxID=1759441 RepID=A0A166V2E4_9AGAM|nr:hypothetical protein FIBSPDRAFT_1036915 [Fibularhizoctonia sp. CBS 109695]
MDSSASLAKLSHISPPTSSGPVIAIDLDDVLSETNQEVANWFNEYYPGHNMTVDDFYYYYYWKNPYWGTPAECFQKVNAFYAGTYIHRARPVPGAREGIQALRDLGYRLIIVTARLKAIRDASWDWIEENFPGLFDSIICTGQFEDASALKEGHELITKLTKQDVCLSIGAKLLIDDSLENALHCASHSSAAGPPTPVLLFGAYEWNKRQSFSTDNRDDRAFAARLVTEGPEFWKKDDVDIDAIRKGDGKGEGGEVPLWRVRNWAETVRWIGKAREEGRL